MKWHIMIVIIVWSLNLAAGFIPQDIEWGTNVSNTLYKGDMLTNGEYTVKIIEFTSPVPGIKTIENNKIKIVPETKVEPAVHIEIYKNGTFIRNIVLTLYSSNYIDPDYEFKITATDFLPGSATEWVLEYYKPWVKISIQKRGVPKFEITYKFTPSKDKNIYYNGDIFTVNVNLKNNGEASAKNIDINLNTGPLRLLTDSLHQSYYKIEKGDSKSFDIMLSVPDVLVEQDFNLTTDQKFYDAKDIEYREKSSTVISTLPRLINIDKSMKDRMYLKDSSIVRIVVSNTGNFELRNIHINDSLNENFNFQLKSDEVGNEMDKVLEWDIPLLKQGQEWSTTYSVKPLEANLNGFAIPSANANFLFNNRQYNISSKTNTVVVNGPKLVLNKTIDKQKVNIGEFVTVKVSIKNVGNIGTRVDVKDTLPENVSLAGGTTYLTNWLDPDAVQGFGYTIRMNREGKVELSAVIGNYIDVEYRGTVRAVMNSERPTIIVIDPNNISNISNDPTLNNTPETPEPNPTIVIPGFDGILAVIGIFFVIIMRQRI